MGRLFKRKLVFYFTLQIFLTSSKTALQVIPRFYRKNLTRDYTVSFVALTPPKSAFGGLLIIQTLSSIEFSHGKGVSDDENDKNLTSRLFDISRARYLK